MQKLVGEIFYCFQKIKKPGGRPGVFTHFFREIFFGYWVEKRGVTMCAKKLTFLIFLKKIGFI